MDPVEVVVTEPFLNVDGEGVAKGDYVTVPYKFAVTMIGINKAAWPTEELVALFPRKPIPVQPPELDPDAEATTAAPAKKGKKSVE